MSIEIVPVTIPASLDAPDAVEFIEMARVRNAIEVETVGNDETTYEPEELLPRWQDPYFPQKLYVARVDGEVVARGFYNFEPAEGSPVAWFGIEVLTAFRGRGVGTRLYERLLTDAIANRRTTIQCFMAQRFVETGHRIVPPTGFGYFDADQPGARFALHRGFTLEQVGRQSRLPLPLDLDRVDRLEAGARAIAGPDYRLVTWTGRTPEEYLDDIAVLHQRMSTDEPSGGLDRPEHQWDAARVRTQDDLREPSPRTYLIAAVIHEPSRTVVGFTDLSVPVELGRPVIQEETVVMGEHRGHRLGMLLKLANLRYLGQTHPGHPSVITGNAEENRHMLSVNEAVGFVAVGREGAWKKVLGPSSSSGTGRA